MLAPQTTTTRSTTLRDQLHDLDSLARLSFDELDALYRGGRVSTTMRAADGALVGRMLAVRGLPRAIASPSIRRSTAASVHSA